MTWPTVLAVVVGGALGAALAWAGGQVLARLRRGVALRPPAVEVAGAVVTGLGVAVTWPSPTTGLVVWAGLLAVILGAVDIVAHRLPDALTLPAVPITAILVLGTWWVEPSSGHLPTALVMAAVVTGLFGALALVAPRAMGRGDVKLVPSLSMLTGYLSVPAVLWWLILAFGLGALVALAGLTTRRLTLGSAIPFGPCLLAGCWLVLAFPEVLTV